MQVPHRIVTDRLVLRQHEAKDLTAFARFLADPIATHYLAFTDEQKSPDGATAMLDYVIASYASEDPVFSLTIADPESDAYLGSCGLNPVEPSGEFEVYFTVIPEKQKAGYATEAMAAVLECLWESTKATQAIAFVMPKNVASIRVAEKLGFVDAGPFERDAATGDHEHLRMAGRKYVLDRPAE